MNELERAVSVKRYDTQLYSSTLYERKDGRFVTYTDFAAAIAERDAARQECERLERDISHFRVVATTKMAMKNGRLENLEADLARANESIRKMCEAADAERKSATAEIESLSRHVDRLVAEVERLKRKCGEA